MPEQDSIIDFPSTVVELPQYYKENFFSKDTLYHPELEGGRYGVAGDPIPYSIQKDHLITGGLILGFLLMCLVLAGKGSFLAKQFKNFFYPLKASELTDETSNELRFQLFFVFMASLLFSLIFYFYTDHYIGDTFNLPSEYALLGIFWGSFILYFLFKAGLYSLVNWVFFDSKNNLQFMAALLFLLAFEGALVFPLVLLLAYFQFPIENAIYYCAGVVILIKILTFYKSYIIFFRQKALFLQIILYFCALEIMPLAVLWYGLLAITNILKVNY